MGQQSITIKNAQDQEFKINHEVVSAPSHGWIIQKAYEINGSSMWTRNSNTNGNYWTAWSLK